jgi:diguanylate cyclase
MSTEASETLPEPLRALGASLYALPLFAGIPRAQVNELLTASGVRRAGPGEVVLSPGQENGALLLLMEGRLQVHLDDPGQPPVAEILPGECVGEMSVIDHQRPSAYVVVRDPAMLLELPGKAVWRLIDASEGMARNLLYILAGRIRTSNRSLSRSLQRESLYERYAHLDPLTNLHNRRWLDRTLRRLVSVDAGAPVTLVLLDIDHFKDYNDRYGHVAGDQALRAIAGALAEHLRPDDEAARYGGEEFAVILGRTPLEQGLAVAERLREVVCRTRVTTGAGEPLPSLTISLGVAQHRPGQSPEELLAAADAGLYRAKRAGRNRVAA